MPDEQKRRALKIEPLPMDDNAFEQLCASAARIEHGLTALADAIGTPKRREPNLYVPGAAERWRDSAAVFINAASAARAGDENHLLVTTQIAYDIAYVLSVLVGYL